MQTPGFTTAVDELTLGQILADIAHRRIRTVCIVATDPLDTIFLARQIRQFLPEVRLITTQSYLLYAHPQNVGDLRGMLIASTYPLFPSNQLWSYSFQGDATHVFFSSESIQGTYNATMAHLEELGNPRVAARFLDYGLPFDPPGSFAPAPDGGVVWKDRTRKPPIWIGIIGNEGISPVKVLSKVPVPDGQPLAIEDDPYLYDHVQTAIEYEELDLAGPGDGVSTRRASWERIRDWFRPRFPAIWQFLFWSFSLTCLLCAGLGALVYRWAGAAPGGSPARTSGWGRCRQPAWRGS